MKSVLLVLVSTLMLGGVARAQPVDPYGAPMGPGARGPGPYNVPIGPGGPMGEQPPRAPNGPLRAALLERFDANHDGRLEPNERMRAIKALRRLTRHMVRAERRAERAQARADRVGERRAERQQARVRDAIRRYDTNGDGIVDPNEIPPAAARRLRPLDRNGDGWVDDADF
jgi:hypothetical protein